VINRIFRGIGVPLEAPLHENVVEGFRAGNHTDRSSQAPDQGRPGLRVATFTEQGGSGGELGAAVLPVRSSKAIDRFDVVAQHQLFEQVIAVVAHTGDRRAQRLRIEDQFHGPDTTRRRPLEHILPKQVQLDLLQQFVKFTPEHVAVKTVAALVGALGKPPALVGILQKM